jgi:hypothetical protein
MAKRICPALRDEGPRGPSERARASPLPPRQIPKEIVAGRRCCAAPISGQSGSSALPCCTLDVLNSVRWGSATVPAAVGNVLLRTSSTPSVRRDADRRVRDARAPHFTRELEKLHPDISKAEVKTKTKLTPTATSAITPNTARGRNPPTIASLTRYGFAVARRARCWRLP